MFSFLEKKFFQRIKRQLSSTITTFLGVKEYNLTGYNKSLRITKENWNPQRYLRLLIKGGAGERVFIICSSWLFQSQRMLESQQNDTCSKASIKALNKCPS